MRSVEIAGFGDWRRKARQLLQNEITPADANFLDERQGQPGLIFVNQEEVSLEENSQIRMPADALHLIRAVAQHRRSERWNLLYELVWRLTHGEAHLLMDHADALVCEVRGMEKAVKRDIHKMHAFVRFRRTSDDVYVAWHRPDHLIVREAATFFARRFANMKWSILTPDECAFWDLSKLSYGPGVPSSAGPAEDKIEDLWLTYYSSIFNPARLKIGAMKAEMPVRHWATLPEAKLIPDLIQLSARRVERMIVEQSRSAAPFVSAADNVQSLADQAACCEGCELYRQATQTVFGKGPSDARIMLVGEQPGDQEDLAGEPFVGPAGRLLERALAAAGILRDEVYITNAVKHFYFEERAKRRIHKRLRGSHISACRPWLEAEITSVNPAIIVCLGATAAQALLGRDMKVLSVRGIWQANRWQKKLLVTVHPASLLRLPDQTKMDQEFERFVVDLKVAAKAVASALATPTNPNP